MDRVVTVRGTCFLRTSKIRKKISFELCTEIQQIDEASHQPRAWDAKGALNLWNSSERMGPPSGFLWLLAFARDDLEVVEICFSIGAAAARRGSGNRPRWN